jgi:SAM-dependent methyltransferase
MGWNKTYSNNNKVWGDRPSELALLAFNFLQQSTQFRKRKDIFILDMGCGYGRDAVFLAHNLPCHILGVDNSEQGIALARESLPEDLEKRIELLCYDFSRVSDKYDVIMASNLYQVLRPAERAKFRETIMRCLKIDGLLFLSTLSVRDPQHYGQGMPVIDEANSFEGEKYVHLCTREELDKDFDFLNLSALYEREYEEPRSTGDPHHHISWLMIGKIK